MGNIHIIITCHQLPTRPPSPPHNNSRHDPSALERLFDNETMLMNETKFKQSTQLDKYLFHFKFYDLVDSGLFGTTTTSWVSLSPPLLSLAESGDCSSSGLGSIDSGGSTPGTSTRNWSSRCWLCLNSFTATARSVSGVRPGSEHSVSSSRSTRAWSAG